MWCLPDPPFLVVFQATPIFILYVSRDLRLRLRLPGAIGPPDSQCPKNPSTFPILINALNNKPKTDHVPITPIPMALFAFKTASRAILRRTHFPSRPKSQPHLTKRHSSTHPATRPKAEDDPANGTAIPIPATVANVPLWQRLGPLSRGFQAYGRSQRKRPYATQFCSSLVIYFLGDLAAQRINGDEYDPKRTARALVISAGSSIPSYRWYVLPPNLNGMLLIVEL